MTVEKLKKIHQTSSGKKNFLLSSSCGCFYCGQIYNPTEIEEWCDKGETPLCPRCGIDSVLCEVSLREINQTLNSDLLEVMHQHYFLHGYEADGTPCTIKDQRIRKFNDSPSED